MADVIQMRFVPTLDVGEWNKILSTLKSSLGDLGRNIKPIDQKDFSRPLESGAKSAQKASKAMGSLNTSITGATKQASVFTKAFNFANIATSVQAVTSGLQAFTGPFVDLNREVQNIGTLGVENFQEFTELTLDLSKKVPDNAARIAQGAYQAISAGISGSNTDVIKFVETASKAAVAGLSDTETSVNALTSVLNAYKLSTDDAGKVSDTFFAAIKLGKTSFGEMSSALATVVPAAASVGVGFDEVSASIAQMTALGVPTAQSATKIRSAIVELQKPTANLAKVYEAAGLSANDMAKLIGEQGLQAALRLVKDEADKLGLSMTQAFSSTEAADAALLLTGENAERAQSTLAQLREEVAGGAAGKAFEVAAQGIGVQTEIMVNKIQALFSGVFDYLGTGFTTVLNSVTQIAPAIQGLTGIGALIPDSVAEQTTKAATGIFNKVKGVASKSIAGIGEVARTGSGQWGKDIAKSMSDSVDVGFKKVRTSSDGFFKGLLGKVKGFGGKAKNLLKGGFSGLVGLLTNPVGLAVAAIGAATAALTYFFSETEEGQKIWNEIKEAISKAVDAITASIIAMWNYIQPALNAFMGVWEEIWEILKLVGELIYTVIVAQFKVLYTVVSTIVGVVGDLIGGFLEWIGVADSGGSVIDTLVGFFNNLKAVLGFVRQGFNGLINVLKFFVSQVHQAIKNLKSGDLIGIVKQMAGFGDGVATAFKDGVSEVRVDQVASGLVEQIEASLQPGIESVSKIAGATLAKGLISEEDKANAVSQIDEVIVKQRALLDKARKDLDKRSDLSEKERASVFTQLEQSVTKTIEEEVAKREQIVTKYNEQVAKNAKAEENSALAAVKNASAAKEKKESALEYLKLQKQESDYAYRLWEVQQDTIRLQDGKAKTTKDEVTASSKRLDNMVAYKESLEEALKRGHALKEVVDEAGNKKTVKVEIDKDERKEIKALVDELGHDIEVSGERLKALKIKAELDDKALEAIKRDIAIETARIDIDLGVGSDKELLEALEAKELAIETELKAPGLDPAKRNELARSLLSIQNEVQSISDKQELQRLGTIKNSAERERQIRLFELEKWKSAEIKAAQTNADAKEQIEREYTKRRVQILDEALRKENSLRGGLVRGLDNYLKTIQDIANADSGRVADIEREIEAIEQRTRIEEEAFITGETNYKDFLARREQLEQEKLDKEKQLAEEAVTFQKLLREGLIASFEEQNQIFRTQMSEAMQGVRESFSIEGDTIKANWDSVTENLGKAAEAGLGVVATQIGQMMAQGGSAMEAMRVAGLNAILDMATNAITANVPVIMATAAGILGPIAGPIAAAALIALVTAGLQTAKAQVNASIQSKQEGGFIEGAHAHVHANEEVGKYGSVVGREFVVRAPFAYKNREVLDKLNRGVSIEKIVEEKRLPTLLAIDEQQKSENLRKENVELRSALKENGKLMEEIRDGIHFLAAEHSLQARHEIKGKFMLEGTNLVAAVQKAMQKEVY